MTKLKDEVGDGEEFEYRMIDALGMFRSFLTNPSYIAGLDIHSGCIFADYQATEAGKTC